MAMPEITRTGTDLLIRFTDEAEAARIEQALSVAFPAVGQPVEPKAEAVEPEPTPAEPNLSVHHRFKSEWNDGFVAEVFVTNEGREAAKLQLPISMEATIEDVWGGAFKQVGSNALVTSEKEIEPGEEWDFTLKAEGFDHSFAVMPPIQAEEDMEPSVPPEVEVMAAPLADTTPIADAPGMLVYAPAIDPREDVKHNLMKGAFGAVYEGGWGYKDAIEIVDDGDGPFLRTHMERGSHAGTKDMIRGAGFDTRTLKVEHAILEYKLRFKPGFDPVKGGKLPGLMGGDSPSGHKSADAGFTARMMWRKDAQGELYLYYPDMKQSHGDSIGRGEFMFYTTGEWQRIRQEVKLNDVGQNNGFIRVWFNNFLVIEATDLRLRTKDSVLIEGMMHTIFFGGSDDSWGASRDEWVDTGDFKIYVP